MHRLNMIYYQMLQTHGLPQPISFVTFHMFNHLIKDDLSPNVTTLFHDGMCNSFYTIDA